MLHRRLWATHAATTLLLLGSLTFLSGCGSKDDGTTSSSSNTGTLRVINATTQRSAVGLLIDDVSRESAIERDATSATYRVTAGSHTIALANSSGSALASTTATIATGSATTLVAWTGDNNVVKYLSLDDLEAVPASGRSKLQVFNAARDAGALDVHLTPASEALGDSPLLGNLAAGSGSSGYSSVNAGSHRLRLLKAGSVLASDVRLDTTVTLPDAGVAALVITPSTGGVLAHALLLQPATAVTALTNTQARVRILSALPTSLSVAGTVNGATLPLLGSSPSFGSYALVPAGASTPQVTVNGGTLTGASWTAAPGSDTTLFVWGTAAAPQFATLSDDNRLPGSSSAARIRLLHGLGNLAQDLTLNIAGAAVTTASQGGMSPVTAVSAVTDTTLSVTSSSTAASVYELTGKTHDANGVYSVFLLGDSSLPSGNGLTTVVVKER
ncbi:DUF4397 domain-containing protein [Sphaerotilus montanus]|uniref:DUF4397 domain-containing protein n=1 Tax=Sphaerotilus montanus TaxID=522889 RepID=UPI003FA2903E